MARVMIRSYHADVSMSIEVLRQDKRRGDRGESEEQAASRRERGMLR